VADHEVEGRHRPGHDRRHAHHREPAELDARADGGARPDRGAGPHHGVEGVLVGIRGAQLEQVGGRGTRVAVVGEGRTGRDHHAVLDGDSVADVHERVDLHPVADGDTVRDVGLLADDALHADRGAGAADVNVVPHRRALTDLDAVLDERGGVDPGRHDQAAGSATPTQHPPASEV
jgi:hypothetical protein